MNPKQARTAWLALIVAAGALYASLLPSAEFTWDDGTWVLDAWLRLKESDWFTLWISTSSGIKQSPLLSWILAVPLAIRPSVTSVQLLGIAAQLATLAFVRQIALRLRLPARGLIAGALIVLLPAMLLNYTSKVCVMGFIAPASAFLLWARLCNRGTRRWVLTAAALGVAIQIHYSFVIYLPLLLVPAQKPAVKKALRSAGIAAMSLLALACFGMPGLPHLRNLADLVLASSPYMPDRTTAIGMSMPQGWFLPWALVPVFLAMIAQRTPGSPRATLRFLWIGSLFALGLAALYRNQPPHHWALAWVVPFALLTEIGVGELWRRFGARVALPAAIFLLAEAAMYDALVFNKITGDGGTGWHGPTLAEKRQLLGIIAETKPASRILLAAPGEEWTYGLTGWTALVSLPGEFLNRLKPISTGVGTLFIEERGSEGSVPGFSDLASSRGWKQIARSGNIYLWEAGGKVEGVWPSVAVVSRRRGPKSGP